MKIFTRRGVFRFLIGIPVVSSLVLAATKPKRRYQVPPTLWYEDFYGRRYIPTREDLCDGSRPKGFDYQHVQFPNELRHSCWGDGDKVFEGTSSWPEDLVLSMANSREYSLGESILIAANLCERCLNAEAYDQGLSWGYPRFSDKWKRTNTCCGFCKES